MTLEEFMASNNVTAFEIVPDVLILNAIVNGTTPYGLDVDTSSIVAGTQLVSVENYTIDGNILNVNNLSLNITTTNINAG